MTKKAKTPEEKAKTPDEKIPFVERGGAKGHLELKFPGFEARWPATSRSAMLIVACFFAMLVVVILITAWQVTSAPPETLERLGEVLGGDRKPEKVQVKTESGIEVIEVCPPCPLCPEPDCPACPPPPPCQCLAPLPPPSPFLPPAEKLAPAAEER